MSSWGAFSIRVLAKGTVSLPALRNPWFFNIYVPETINILGCFKQDT